MPLFKHFLTKTKQLYNALLSNFEDTSANAEKLHERHNI